MGTEVVESVSVPCAIFFIGVFICHFLLFPYVSRLTSYVFYISWVSGTPSALIIIFTVIETTLYLYNPVFIYKERFVLARIDDIFYIYHLFWGKKHMIFTHFFDALCKMSLQVVRQEMTWNQLQKTAPFYLS